jgi:hypothetical protein
MRHTSPDYQRNDYLSWITRAKREETQQKRLEQMLDELERGHVYTWLGVRVELSSAATLGSITGCCVGNWLYWISAKYLAAGRREQCFSALQRVRSVGCRTVRRGNINLTSRGVASNAFGRARECGAFQWTDYRRARAGTWVTDVPNTL